jgi:predicted PurR-regulated permease PerM
MSSQLVARSGAYSAQSRDGRQMAEFLGSKIQFQAPLWRAENVMARSLTVLATLGVVAALSYAQEILVPLVLAVLLTFVLAPGVRLFMRWGLPQLPSVLIVVVCAFLLLFGVGSFLAQQIAGLAERLPQYQSVIQQKIQSISGAATGGTLQRFSGFLENLNKQLLRRDGQSTIPGTQSPSEPSNPPIPVEIHQPAPTPVEFLQRFLPPLLNPLATIGLVIVFVIFFLLQRRDLRDRFIRLAGSHDLKRTTEALDDAAHRLSRYFLAQTALNALFGVVVAIGLGLIGIPNPVLWGILSMVLRFVPYIGAAIAAAFPTALAIAVGPDWSMALWTIGLFAVVEPLIGQALEPLVYGHSTGLSPVAVIIAATFWTWLWGPVGLLLSTPLTVCIGVLGRHIEWLQSIDILIGGAAPLTPVQSFYQRALAGDADEASDQAEELLKDRSLLDYYDCVVLQGLILAEVDVLRGLLDEKHVSQINEVVRELIEDLADHQDKTPERKGKEADPVGGLESSNDAPERQEDLQVLQPGVLSSVRVGHQLIACVAGRGPFDETIAAILVQLLEKHGLQALLETSAVSSSNVVRLNGDAIGVVCLSSVDIGQSHAAVRNAVRRIRRQLSGVEIVVGLWGHDASTAANQELRTSMAADRYAFSLRQALSHLIEITSLRDEKPVGPTAA